MATKLRKTKRAAPVRRAARKTSRSASKSSARRRVAAARGKAKPKPVTKPKAAPRKQTFVASHLNPDAFEGGLRSYANYHDVEFQMIYVLKGWIKGEYDGAGEVTMVEGSCWLQPPKIKHTVLDYSDDCELLEIILPAEFDTVELE